MINQTSTKPLVSVIIPAYNAEAFISQTLTSVLAQTYQNIEVLVIDDGSQDRTPHIVKSFVQQDDRVQLLQQANAGVAAARNLGLQHARGELIAPVDADDIWYPQNLEKRVQCMAESSPIVGVVYAWSVDIDEAGHLTGGFHASELEGDVYLYLAYRNFLGNASASLIRRICFETIGGYSSDYRAQKAQGCEDRDLYLRIAEQYEYRVVPEFLIGYRKLVSSMSCDYSSMARSHLLVHAQVQSQHPEIPADFYRFSNSNFFLYLAKQSSLSGNDSSTLLWLYRALRQHPALLLRHQLYTLTIASCFGILIRPMIRLLGSAPLSWTKLAQRWKARSKPIEITEVYQRMVLYQHLPWKQYEKDHLHRYKVAFREQVQSERWLTGSLLKS